MYQSGLKLVQLYLATFFHFLASRISVVNPAPRHVVFSAQESGDIIWSYLETAGISRAKAGQQQGNSRATAGQQQGCHKLVDLVSYQKVLLVAGVFLLFIMSVTGSNSFSQVRAVLNFCQRSKDSKIQEKYI